MKAFIAILLTILVIGLAIVQLILIRWTDGWLWPILHAALVIVSFRKKSDYHLINQKIFQFLTSSTSLIGFNSRHLADIDQGSSLGCLSVLLEPDNKLTSHGSELEADSGDGQVVQGGQQVD